MQSRVLGATPVDWMPMAETMHDQPPDWIVPIANSRLILSASGSAFLVDCGSQRIIQEVRKLQQAGRFRRLHGIYITHYHDDHTDHAQAASDEFHCPFTPARKCGTSWSIPPPITCRVSRPTRFAPP